jgi:hypothetical protein
VVSELTSRNLLIAAVDDISLADETALLSGADNLFREESLLGWTQIGLYSQLAESQNVSSGSNA